MRLRQATGWQPRHRPGVAALEAAVVYPVLFLLLLGLVVGGLGVFRYQLVAGQAREAARWASVRGSDWAKENQKTSPTKADILQKAIQPLAVSMDVKQIAVQVVWIDGISGQATDWDSASKAPTSRTAQGVTVSNRVRVTVSYTWFPEVYFAGPYTLQSVSEMPMAY